MVLHLHRAPRTDLLADAPRRAARDAAGRPVRDGARARARARRGAVAQPAALPPARHGASVAATACARASSSGRPRSLVAELTGTRDDDPWAPDALVWPLLVGARRQPSTSRGRPPWRCHLGHGHERRRGRAPAGPPLRRRAAAGRAVRVVRRAAAAAARRLGGGPATATASAATSTPTWPGSRELWRRAGGGGRRARPGRAARRRPSTRLRDDPGPSTCRRGSRCSATPGCRSPRSSCSAALGDAPRRPPVAAAPLRRRCGSGADRPGGAGAARATTTATGRSGHPLLASLGRDVRELQRTPGPRPSCRRHDVEVATDPRGPARRLLGWLQADLARQRRPSPSRPRPRPTATVASRCTRCHGAGPPGRGAARGAARAARRRPDPRAARHPGDVPRHRDLRAADHRRRSASVTSSSGGPPRPPAAGPARRPGAAPRPTRCSAVAGAAARPRRRPRRRPAPVLDLAAAPSRSGAASASPTTTSTRSPTGSREAGVRWGFDARAPRRRSGWPATSQNTWRVRPRPGARRRGDVRGRAARWLGTDAAARRRRQRPASSWPAGSPSSSTGCSRVTDRLTGTRPLADWLDALARRRRRADRASRATTSWQVGQVQRELAAVAADASDAGRHARAAAARRPRRCSPTASPAGRPAPTSAPARLTVCTMVPMRSVPHRVVCLLGLDDGVFPRPGPVDGDDVLARDPLTGERDVRSEDRQLLLDAIMRRHRDAGGHLHRRRRAHAASTRPPAVPLGELLDALDRTADRRPVRDASSSSTRCSRFDARNVEPGRLGTPTPFTFDPPRWRRPGRRRVRGRAAAVPRAAARRRRAAGADVALADLVDVLPRPGQGLPPRRLDVTLPWDVDERRRRDAGRDRQPGDSGASATGCSRDMLRGIHPDQALRDRVAPRRAAAGPARLAHGQRGRARPADAPRGRGAHAPPGQRPRAVDVDVDLRRRPAAHAAPSPASTATGWSRSATPGSTPSTGWRPGSALLALRAGRPRPQLDGADRSAAAAATARQTPRTRLLGPAVDGAADAALRDLVDALRRRHARAAPAAAARRRSPGPRARAPRRRPASRRRRRSGWSQPVPRRGRRRRPRAGLGRARRSSTLLGRAPAPGEERAGRGHPARRPRTRLWVPLLRASERRAR